VEYHVNESDLVLVDEFSLFVKGGSLNVEPTLPGLPGSIRSVAVTAKGGLDGSIICPATPYHPFIASDMYVKRNNIVSSYDSYTRQKPFESSNVSVAIQLPSSVKKCCTADQSDIF